MATTSMDAAACARLSAATTADATEASTREPHWVAITVVDADGRSVSGYPYRLEDAAGNTSGGVLAREGTVCRDGLPEGTCTLTVEVLCRAMWAVEVAATGERVGLSARAPGVEDGTQGLFRIYRCDVEGPDVLAAELGAVVQDEAVEGTWRVDPEAVLVPEVLSDGACYHAPQFYFEALVGHAAARSGWLRVEDALAIRLVDAGGWPIGHAAFVLTLADGTVRRGRVDARGLAREDRVPPGSYRLEFPEYPGLGASARLPGGEPYG